MEVLEINNINNLTKNITEKFNDKINNIWLTDNIGIIKKLFDIRTKKYDVFIYHNIYLLMITILKNLFDNNLFIMKPTRIKNIQYKYYIVNKEILKKHESLINYINIKNL
jgi:hypothetical protein